MSDGMRAFSEVDELTEKIGNLQIELKKLDTALAHPVFENFKKLQAKENVFITQNEYFSSLLQDLEIVKAQLIERVSPKIPVELQRDPALQRNRDLIDKTNNFLASSCPRNRGS
jgi:NifB/MoaA-like Fe-S oxidoreductase